MAVDTPRVEKRKIAYGTKNMTKEPAMTRAQAVAAIEAGIAKAQELKNLGYELLATGEMGIGNTTTSSAMTAVFLGMEPEMVTGRGAGLSGDGLKRKVQAIRRAIFLHERMRQIHWMYFQKWVDLTLRECAGCSLAVQRCRCR